MAHAIRKRRDVLVNDLHGEGLTVNMGVLERVGCPAAAPAERLRGGAAHRPRRGDAETSSFIARFWGREQDRALSAVFSPTRRTASCRPAALFESSIDLAPRLNRKTYSFHSILALNILTHQVSKVTGAPETDLGFEVPGRQSAFMMRGVVMGSLIGSNDIELAERYRRELDSTPVYAALEEWSFPTYTRDGRISSDFTLPSSLSLRNTATEVLREIAEYNDAYVYYLVSTYIPLALQRDPAFGGKLTELIRAVESRGADCRDKRIRQTCNTLVRQLKGIA